MSSSPSEERSLPASDKKLRDARKKGQVAKSADMTTAVVMLACTLYIAVAARTIEGRVRDLFDVVMRVNVDPYEGIITRMITLGWEIIILSIFPLVAITILAVIITNLVVMKGFVFSADPIAPKFERINPAEGAKRIFSMRSISEFVKSLVKVVALATAFVSVFYMSLQGLMQTPRCDFYCIEGVFLGIIRPLVITAIVAFFVIGTVDVLVQKWLFRREQRMTKSELKRERKDMYGDPEIRRERQSLRRGMQAFSTKLGVQHATILIGRANDCLVGVRYVSGETRVPVIVCKAGSDGGEDLVHRGAMHGIPMISNPELARRVSKGRSKGEPIPDECFQAVADLLISEGLV